MSDFEFRDDAEIKAVFKFEVGREQNDHNLLYNKSYPNQHPIEAITGLSEKVTNFDTHIADKNNPHEVTKSQVGLGNVDNTSDVNKPISTATQSALDLKVNTADLGNAELDIQKNGTSVGKFTANASTDKVINIVVPTKASDVNALPDSTKYGASLSLSINPSTFVVTAQLKDQDGGNLGSAQTIDLPLESVVVNGTYDSINKKIVLTLENGNTVDIPVGDLIAGLQSEITVDNKLSADLVDDSSANHKFVTASEKSQITTNANNIVDLQNNKASTSLDNLTADGQIIIDTVDGKISNCILDIPQNIKLKLENNVLTIKSGSIGIIPGSTYTESTNPSDKTYTIPNTLNDGIYAIFTARNFSILVPQALSKIQSGTETPTEAGNYKFFNVTDRKIYIYDSTTLWHEWSVFYPFCLIEMKSGTASFAKDSNDNDMIFNGMGFIGHHIFIYPNIKAYMPTELNPDGSLASTKIRTNALRIIEALSGYGVDSLKRWISLQSNRTVSNWSAYKEVNHDSEADYTIANVRYYARDINLIKMYRSGSVSAVDGVPLVEYYYDGSNITSFTPKQCVRLATIDMLDKVQNQVNMNTTAIDGKQDTLVSGTNIKTINSTTVLGNGNFILADQSLSNLDSNGQMIVDSQNGTISNCILEIPQNIKLELSNNVLTLKAGSTVVLSGSTYTTHTTTQDITFTYVGGAVGQKYLIFLYVGGFYRIERIEVELISSGATDSLAEVQNHLWFDTTNREIKYFRGSTDTYELVSYPIAFIEKTSSFYKFVKDSNGNDMIFNGAGFIGHHAFVYPNVKVLAPNGFNADGSLKSLNYTTNSLIICELPTYNSSDRALFLESNSYVMQQLKGADVDTLEDLQQSNYYYQYVIKENQYYQYQNNVFNRRNVVKIIDFSNTGTTVTDFAIRQPVRTATVEMLDKKQADLTTVSGYDATATQVLKHINGVLTWVTEE